MAKKTKIFPTDPLKGWEEREAAKPPHIPMTFNDYDDDGTDHYKTVELVLDQKFVAALQGVLKMEAPPRKTLDYDEMRLKAATELITSATQFPHADGWGLNWSNKTRRTVKVSEVHVLHPDDIARYLDRLKSIDELEKDGA